MKPSKWVCWIAKVLLCAAIAAPAFAEIYTLDKANIVAQPNRSAAVQDSSRLPYRWDEHFPGENGTISYQIALPTLKTREAPQLYALYAPRVGGQVEVRLNDELIGTVGMLNDAWVDAAKTPLWVVFPMSRLREDRPNVVEILTTSQSTRMGGLSEVYFAPEEELHLRHAIAFWWQQSSYIVILVAIFLMGMISWILWARQREGLYGLFALSAMWGGFSTSDQLMTTSWLPWPLQGIVAAVALAWHVIFMARFTLGIVGQKGSWVRLALLATTMAIGIAFVLAEPVYWTVAFGFLCLPMAATLFYTAKAADSERSGQARLLFAVSLVVALTAFRDFFVVHLPESGMSHFALLPHALFLYTLVMGWLVVQRYTEQHRKYQELNVTLEQRVQEREQQLAQSFEKIKQNGEEQAKLLERQRIMSDIHDGVGGQLVGLVNMIKRGEANQSLFDQKQLSEHAQMALDELRVAIDSMQPVDGDLTTVLATLRYRLAPRLKASDIALVWRVDELPTMDNLTPQKVLQIQRILLEAFTNVMQHANAKTVTIQASHLPEISAVQIILEDDGVGFDLQKLESTGHGLRNMRFRAEAIGALITFERAPQRGARLILTLSVA